LTHASPIIDQAAIESTVWDFRSKVAEHKQLVERYKFWNPTTFLFLANEEGSDNITFVDTVVYQFDHVSASSSHRVPTQIRVTHKL
jgi:hypothetical protein